MFRCIKQVGDKLSGKSEPGINDLIPVEESHRPGECAICSTGHNSRADNGITHWCEGTILGGERSHFSSVVVYSWVCLINLNLNYIL